MSFKSKAQRRKCAEMVRQGKLSQETFDKWEAETPHDIPETAAGRPLKTGVRRPKYQKRYK